MKKIALFLLTLCTAFAQPTPVQVQEASVAQVAAGTVGMPYVITPRRLGAGGAVVTNSVTSQAGNDLVLATGTTGTAITIGSATNDTVFSDTTDATAGTASTGSVQLAGGMSIAKSLNIGTVTPGNISGLAGALTIAAAGTSKTITLLPTNAADVLIGGADIGFMRPAANLLRTTNGVGGRGSQDMFMLFNFGGVSAVSTQYDNTTTTLGNVTGLTCDLIAARTYIFEAELITTSNVGGGVKAAILASGAVTRINYQAIVYSGTTIAANDRATASGTAVGAVTAVTVATIKITGTVVTSGAITLTVQLAANVAVGTTSALIGSTFHVTGGK